jgi:hypothetical protein
MQYPYRTYLVLMFCLKIPSQKISVADPGCLSRIPNLGSRIQKQQKQRRVKKISCPTFFCSHKYHKLKIILFLSRKKLWANLNKIKIWFWDPGSRIWKNQFRISDPGLKKAPDPRSGSATLHDNSVSGKFGYHPGVLAEIRKLENKQ